MTILELVRTFWPALCAHLEHETDQTFTLSVEVRPLIAHLAAKCWHLWSPEDMYVWKARGEELTAAKLQSVSRLYSVRHIVEECRRGVVPDAETCLDEVLQREDRTSVTPEEDRRCGFFCPSSIMQQRLCRLPEGSIDNVNRTNAHWAAAAQSEGGDFYLYRVPDGNLGTCGKDFYANNIFTPGLFLICCGCTNKVVYVAFFMDSGESPRAFVNAIRNRLKKAPEYFFYDFACQFHQYAMHRYWWYFFNTKFICDRFHASNHSTCSVVYQPSQHTDDAVTSANTQGCEQNNAMLDRNTKASIRYMSLWNAVLYISVYFIGLSANKKKLTNNI